HGAEDADEHDGDGIWIGGSNGWKHVLDPGSDIAAAPDKDKAQRDKGQGIKDKRDAPAALAAMPVRFKAYPRADRRIENVRKGNEDDLHRAVGGVEVFEIHLDDRID